jgi:NACalpha-BTF3-like transcription factor
MTAEEEAKQLDSVTDRVQETELDASRSNKALSALNSSKLGATAASISVKKEDVNVIVSELEVTEDEAAAALRAVAAEGSVDGGSLVTEALRRLVTS